MLCYANASNYTQICPRVRAHCQTRCFNYSPIKKRKTEIGRIRYLFLLQRLLIFPSHFPTMHRNLSAAAIIRAAMERLFFFFKATAVSRCKHPAHRGIHPKTMSDCVDRAFVRIFAFCPSNAVERELRRGCQFMLQAL